MRKEEIWMYTNPIFVLYIIGEMLWDYSTIGDWWFYHTQLDKCDIVTLNVFLKLDTKMKWYWPHKVLVNRATKRRVEKLLTVEI